MFRKLILFAGLSSQVQAGPHCGSKSGYLHSIASSVLIPEEFPPDAPILRSLIEDSELLFCKTASFSDACQQHDSCYELRIPKNICDKQLLTQWISSCQSTYLPTTSSRCMLGCLVFAQLLSQIQRFQADGFCPSCNIYDGIPAKE